MRTGVAVLWVTACDPATLAEDPWAPAARTLLERVQSDRYEEWSELAIEGDAPHGHWSIVFANDVLVDAEAGDVLERWPDDTVVVCEGRDEAEGPATTIQIMTRDGGGWTWAQYDGEGEPLLFGSEPACSHCHAAGDDYLRSFSLPAG